MASRRKQQREIRRQFNRLAQSGHCRPRLCGAAANRELGWIPRIANARVLDLGCGPGTHLLSLSRGARLLVELDLSDSMLGSAARRRRYDPAIVFTQGDAQVLPFASGSFDLCFCAFCFAHFLDPRQAVQEMARILRPQGLLAVLDVVATAPRQLSQVNRLERSRDFCYTRIQEMKAFQELFSGLPLEWISRRLTRRAVTLRKWMAASVLRQGTASFVRAGREFRRAAAQQQAGLSSRFSSAQPQYYYTAARFLLRKTS